MDITTMGIDAPGTHGQPGPAWKRLAWFVGLWAAGVLAVGSVAYLIRWWLKVGG